MSSERFFTDQGVNPQGYFVYFKDSTTQNWEKDPLVSHEVLSECVPIKRERGECFIHPAVAPVSRMSAYSAYDRVRSISSSGGQNLAALCTAAGQNLTAVGSSHSLTETVDLGTMTTAGLVGTLHKFTPPIFLFFICSTAKLAAATHIKVPDHSQAEPL